MPSQSSYALEAKRRRVIDELRKFVRQQKRIKRAANKERKSS